MPREAQLWLPGYLGSRLRARRRRAAGGGPIDILFCVADHYEPDHGRADLPKQRTRVQRWQVEYPRLAAGFRDADGRGPQHTFFSPLEVYQPDLLDRLAALCGEGHGEVEVHLHHGHDTSAALREKLEVFRDTLVTRHGLLGRRADGRPAYGFIHGNWALDNGRLDARYCGVNDELTVLHETGCYADFTMPAAPDPAQSRVVNSLYYAVDDPDRPRSYDAGPRVRVGRRPVPGALAMIQGPLGLRWNDRVAAIMPRVDNGSIDASAPPSAERFRLWLDAGVSVEGRSEWVFVKVHTHGAKDSNADILLGSSMYRFHEALAREFNDGRRYRLHYVTAREMYNVMKAAEDGKAGNPGQYRDYLIARPTPAGAAARTRESAARA